jgi:hypothetical protein
VIPISIKNLVEKLNLFSFKRINSHNNRSEVNNQNAPISWQINNQITKQVNYYGDEEKKKKTVDNESTQQGEYIPLDQGAVDPLGSNVWNKVF